MGRRTSRAKSMKELVEIAHKEKGVPGTRWVRRSV
jgi:hypothetical protein